MPESPGQRWNLLRKQLQLSFPRQTRITPCFRHPLHHLVDFDRTKDTIQNGAEKADERQKLAEKVTHEYHRIPKIGSCVLLTSKAKSVTQKGVVNKWSGCRALTGKILLFWLSGRLQEVVANKGYCRGIACCILLASDLRPTSQTS